METTIIIINWFGTFLLAIEAIRISNFRKLTIKLLNFRTAINPRFYHGKDGETYIPVAPRGYKIIRKLAFIIELTMGYFIIIVVLSIIGYLGAVVDFYKIQFSNLFNGLWYFIILKVYIAFFVLVIPGFLGALVTMLFTRFAESYNTLLIKLEYKVAAGTIGLIGFLLLSLGFIIDLLKIHYFS